MALRLLRETLGTLQLKYGAFVLAVLCFGSVSLLPPLIFRFFTESAERLDTMRASDFIVQLAVFGMMVAVALLIAAFGRVLCEEWLRLRLESELRRRLMRHLHEIPLRILDRSQRGDWFTRMTSDLDHVELFLTESIPNQLRSLSMLLGTSALFVYYSGGLALIPLVTAIVMAWLNSKMQRRLSPILAELRGLHGGVFQRLIETVEGIRTIRSHAVEPYVQRRFEEKLHELTSKSLRVVRTLGGLLGGNEFATQLMVTGCLTVVAWALAAKAMTVNQVLVYPFFISLFYQSALALANATYDWNRFFIEGGRLGELLYDQCFVDERVALRPELTHLQACSQLRIESLKYGQDQGLNLGPLDLSLRRGELWLMMGPSGAGKSTLLEVLSGLRPFDGGSVRFSDGAGTMLWHGSRHSQFPIAPCSFVEQHPYIFEGTLRENLIFGNPSRPSDALLWHLLERVSLYQFARGNGGLDYFLRDRGRNLSEGERYRIALCRALLLNRPFLLLDEPFAALDEYSVQIVVRALHSELSDSGILIVTHYVPEGLRQDGIIRFSTDGGIRTAPVNEPAAIYSPASNPMEKYSDSPLGLKSPVGP